ncbi:MAG: hypothetical protein ABSD88_05730 [Candidatus Korobacteraceae bacterium]
MSRVMKRGEKYPYEIVKRNLKTNAVIRVEIVIGESRAADRVDRYNEKRPKEEIEAGWRYEAYRTTQKPPTKPKAKAGSHIRESRRDNSRR